MNDKNKFLLHFHNEVIGKDFEGKPIRKEIKRKCSILFQKENNCYLMTWAIPRPSDDVFSKKVAVKIAESRMVKLINKLNKEGSYETHCIDYDCIHSFLPKVISNNLDKAFFKLRKYFKIEPSFPLNLIFKFDENTVIECLIPAKEIIKEKETKTIPEICKDFKDSMK